MKKIIFVCTGNTCRSAMAHKMLEKMTKEKNKEIEVFSCGTGAWDEAHSTYEAIKVMEEYNVDLKTHKATHINRANIDAMDAVLCVTTSHKNYIANNYPELKDKVYTIKEYAGNDESDLELNDPWGYDIATYRKCAKEIEECIERILEKV